MISLLARVLPSKPSSTLTTAECGLSWPRSESDRRIRQVIPGMNPTHPPLFHRLSQVINPTSCKTQRTALFFVFCDSSTATTVTVRTSCGCEGAACPARSMSTLCPRVETPTTRWPKPPKTSSISAAVDR